MRYSLRNQHKIKAHFAPNGEEMLKRITDSLDNFFNISQFLISRKGLEYFIQPQIPGELYPRLSVNDVGSENRMIDFYVVSLTFDVMRLAFIGFTKI